MPGLFSAGWKWNYTTVANLLGESAEIVKMDEGLLG